MPRSRDTAADGTSRAVTELGSRARIVAGFAAATVVTAVPAGAIATVAAVTV